MSERDACFGRTTQAGRHLDTSGIGRVPVRGLAQIAVRFWAPFLQLRGALSSRIGMFGVEGGQVS